MTTVVFKNLKKKKKVGKLRNQNNHIIPYHNSIKANRKHTYMPLNLRVLYRRYFAIVSDASNPSVWITSKVYSILIK